MSMFALRTLMQAIVNTSTEDNMLDYHYIVLLTIMYSFILYCCN